MSKSVRRMGNIFKRSKSKMSHAGTDSASDRPSSSSKYNVGAAGEQQQRDVKQFSRVHSEAVMALTVARGLCLSGGQDTILALTDSSTGSVIRKWTGHSRELTKVVYGSATDTYFSSSRDKTVNAWLRDRNEPIRSFVGHDLVVTGITLNGDNTVLCSGSRDNSVRLWDVASAKCSQTKSLAQNIVTHVKWSSEGNLIVQSSEDKEVRVWDARMLEVVGGFPRKQHIQTCCDVSADQRYCLSTSNGFDGNGCEATLWDMRTLRLVAELRGHSETVGACCFIPPTLGSGSNLVATCSNDCTVRLWDRDSHACLSVVSIPGSGPLTSIAVDENNNIFVSSFNAGIQKIHFKQSGDGSLVLERKAEF